MEYPSLKCLYRYCNGKQKGKPAIYNVDTGEYMCCRSHLYLYGQNGNREDKIDLETCVCGMKEEKDDPLELDERLGIRLCHKCLTTCKICKENFTAADEKLGCLQCYLDGHEYFMVCYKQECRKKHEHKLSECSICTDSLFVNSLTTCPECYEDFCDLDCFIMHCKREIDNIIETESKRVHKLLICNSNFCRNDFLSKYEIELKSCYNGCCRFCDYLCFDGYTDVEVCVGCNCFQAKHNLKDCPNFIKQTTSKKTTDHCDINICKICFEKEINCVLLQCGHLCICFECGSLPSVKTCPICRQVIDSVKRIA